MIKLLSFVFICLTIFSIAQSTDANGKKQGLWIKKDPSGQHVIYEGTFKDDKPVGKFKYFHPNDTLRAIMYFKQDGKVAYAKLFHMSTGKLMGLGKYVTEIKDSVWTYYDESGSLLSKDSYTMGKKNGTCYVYLRNGQMAEERNYNMDQQHGPFKLYIDGKKLRGQGNYVNGQLEGKATYYYPNGVEVAAGFYKNGQKIGPWIYKEENGKIKEKEWYIDGKLASAKETDALFAKNKTIEKTATSTTTTNGIYNLKKDKKNK